MADSFTGKWKNQRGSVLNLKVEGGVVSGTFDSAVGDGGVLSVKVEGRTLGDVITFNAVYEQFGTIVSWVGQMTDDGGKALLDTVWIHGSNIEDANEADQLWSAVRTGGDQFRPAA